MKTLIVELGLSTDCNLGCLYCYSKHEPKYMESFDINEFESNITPIMEYYGCDNYHISYFGGEPLLNWGIIESSLPAFKQSSKCSSVVVISNGLALTQKRVDFLKSYNCGLSWSFDGLWSFNRPLANSQSSFEIYQKIIPLARQLTSSCKVMVSPTCKDFVKNMEYFLSIGIKIPDFCLVRDDIWTKGSIDRFKSELNELTNYIISKNSHHSGDLITTGLHTLYVLDSFAGAKFGKRDHGCFVGANGITYTYNNEIYPCERFRSANKFKLGGYDQYDQNNKYTYNYENLEFLKSISNPQNYEKCQKCELYKYCNAGCTYSQFGKNFEVVEPVDSVCDLLKICYKEGLRAYQNCNSKYKEFIHKMFENAK